MTAKTDLLGQRVGRLVVTAEAKSRNGRAYWNVQCDCGATKEVMGKHLISGAIQSCGCLSRETTSKVRRLRLVGKKFGKLTVLRDTGTASRSTWECQCECGNVAMVTGDRLVSGNTKSCGCLQKEVASAYYTTHGLAHTPTYNSWANMKQRCLNQKSEHYAIYGGRGITVEPEWLDFSNFLRDMGEKPEGLTLERLDVDGPYSKENCVWATWDTQAANKRRNIKINLYGVETPLDQACYLLGVSYSTAASMAYKLRAASGEADYNHILYKLFRGTRTVR